MQKSVITKKTKSTEEKPSFLSIFQEYYIENINNKIPIVKILSSDPKPGCTWLTYPQGSSTLVNDETLTIYIAKEHFGKDGQTKKIYIKNEEINDIFLTSLRRSLHKYNSVTTIKLQNCNLSANEIEILSSILKEFKNIIDINVDDNPNKNQNYYVLLRDTNIKYLSLKGCKINKYGLELLCQELTFDSNSNLVMLNLTSNRIDDTALSFLSQVLRENRKITSLILADNWITDTGCQELMNVFQKFTLTNNEILIRRHINFNYFIQKVKLLEQYKLDCSKSVGSLESISYPRKKSSTITAKEKSLSTISRESSTLSETQRIELYIEKYLPKSTHPFVTDCVAQNGDIYCKGNLAIAHLNLARNKLTSSGYKHVIDTLRHQLTDESGKNGLLNIVLDGNYDSRSHEFLEIRHILLEQRKKFSNIKIKNPNRRSVYSSMTFK